MPLLLLLLFSITLTACSFMGPVKTPPVHTYVLAADKTAGPSHSRTAKSKKILLVSSPAADASYQTTQMIYTLRPFTYSSFAYHRWAAPPADMLASALTNSLQSSGCFDAVVMPPFSGNADAILETRLRVLQQEFHGETSQAHLSMQVTFTQHILETSKHMDYVQKLDDPKEGSIVKTIAIDLRVPAAENTPYAGVVAANRALEIAEKRIQQLVCRGG
jgi:cholesterol transport system auxiliary component